MHRPPMSSRAHLWRASALAIALSMTACSDPEPAKPSDPLKDMTPGAPLDQGPDQDMTPDQPGPSGPVLQYAPDEEDFFAAPFPSDVKLDAQGKIDLSAWKAAMGRRVLPLWFEAGKELLDGWSPISGVFWALDAEIDPKTLPQTVQASVATDPAWPSVFLMDVDPSSPDKGKLLPLECRFTAKAGPLTPPNLLGCMSPLGVVRRVKTRYALVVTRGLKDAQGQSVTSSEAMRAQLRGEAVPGRGRMISGEPTAQARQVIVDAGLPAEQIVAINVFTTGDPTARLRQVNAFYQALPEPTLDRAKGVKLVETYDDYVVLEAYYDVPIVQEGTFPYSAPPEGKLKLNAQGQIEQVGTQSIRVFISVPRSAQPPDGFPLLMYLHGSGGVARELMDRGPMPDAMSAAPAGSGPGGVAARFGVAGFAADFQFHGMRYSPPDSTGLVLYNLFGNPRATVDNFIVAANEVTLHARLMRGLRLKAQDIEPAEEAARQIDFGPSGELRFDDARFAAMGQSMGSTIGLPAMTVDRVTDAAIFSGSGGVLIEIAVTSMKPVDVNRILRTFLRYGDSPLDQYDPALHAVQHVWDFVDPTVHARHVFSSPYEGVAPKHVIQHSGLMDGYFTPSSRAAFSLALGTPLVTPVLEPEALERMALGGLGEPVQPPLRGNAASGVTALVVQYSPEVLDGHNVAYQLRAAQDQYGCFIKSLSKDAAPIFRSVSDSTPERCEP